MKPKEIGKLQADEEALDDFEPGNTSTSDIEFKPPSDSTKWFFDYQLLFMEIKANLLGGELYEKQKGVFIIRRDKYSKPVMTREGVEATLGIIKPFTNKILATSIMSAEDIQRNLLSVRCDLILLYALNLEKFGLNKAQASVIIHQIMMLLSTNLYKSINGTALNMIGKTERVSETIVRNEQHKGWLPKL